MPEITKRIRYLDIVQAYINALPRNLRGIATKAMAEWFVGNKQRGLKHEPAYKYVSRASAYTNKITIDYGPHKGKVVQGYQSSKQYYFVILGGNGKINPGVENRTHAYSNSWTTLGRGAKTVIYGNLPHSQWVDRLNLKVGWRNIPDIIASNMAGAVRHANAKIKEWLK